MRTQEIVTSDLSQFGARERRELVELLQAWENQGLPDDFYDSEVTVAFNRNSGCVFLENSEYQAAMLNGDTLETWYHCPECGHEGFAEDCSLNRRGCNECNPDHCNDCYKVYCDSDEFGDVPEEYFDTLAAAEERQGILIDELFARFVEAWEDRGEVDKSLLGPIHPLRWKLCSVVKVEEE